MSLKKVLWNELNIDDFNKLTILDSTSVRKIFINYLLRRNPLDSEYVIYAWKGIQQKSKRILNIELEGPSDGDELYKVICSMLSWEYTQNIRF